MKRRLQRKLDTVLETAGLKKKRQIETPWERVDSSHVQGKGGLMGWLEAKKRAYDKFSEEANRRHGHIFGEIEKSMGEVLKDFEKHEKTLAKMADEGARLRKERERRMGHDKIAEEYDMRHSERKGEAVRRLMGQVMHQNVKTPEQVLSICADTTDCPLLLPHEKLAFLQQLVRTHRPRVALDLGTYAAAQSACAIMVADDNVEVHTIERNQMMVRSAHTAVQKFPQKRITLHEDDTASFLRKKRGQRTYDLVLFDHSPMFYNRDVDLMLRSQLLAKGCIVALHYAKGNQEFSAEVMDRMARDERFKPMHGPPTSPLFVYRYIGGA